MTCQTHPNSVDHPEPFLDKQRRPARTFMGITARRIAGRRYGGGYPLPDAQWRTGVRRLEATMKVSIIGGGGTRAPILVGALLDLQERLDLTEISHASTFCASRTPRAVSSWRPSLLSPSSPRSSGQKSSSA